MNSDVTVFMLDVLPRLMPGVIIHFHDIALPYDYPDSLVPWHWSEQYILGVYLLAAASRVRVLLPNFYFARKPEIQEILRPLANAGWAGPPAAWLYGGSFWFTHV